MKRISKLTLAGALTLAAVPAYAAGTANGVYTEAQAAEGAAVFAERCAMCHGKQAEGTWEVPALKGKFMGNWGRESLAALSDYLARAMPQFAPGTLEPKDNGRLVAYLLKINGHPAGAKPLPEDHAALAAIRIDPLAATAVK
ncbi:mono/diheme cytochrome c family protein [Novosphingobium sp. SG751A]|uniref:c-type cytochrome n=1 Tax=Novosphingobium sp. SG751A TaxID=2587000 RepID=UPI001554B977|nr:cytochrome c [Novosphingobium sp. SG751A]NOW47536.1 mono/diheme cytochrome c family protein [Novosphingobium sp. SG751A]